MGWTYSGLSITVSSLGSEFNSGPMDVALRMIIGLVPMGEIMVGSCRALGSDIGGGMLYTVLATYVFHRMGCW